MKTPADIQLAAKLIAMHTERSLIRAAMETITPQMLTIVTNFPDEAVVDRIVEASGVLADADAFAPSDAVRSFVLNNMLAQLTTEIEQIERDLTGMGVRLEFLSAEALAPKAPSARPDPFDLIKDIMRALSPEAAAYADAKAAKIKERLADPDLAAAIKRNHEKVAKQKADAKRNDSGLASGDFY